MAIKFDGEYVKDGSRTVGNLLDGKNLREGSSRGGKVLGNIASGDEVREGSSRAGKVLCNVKDGKYIRQGSSSAGSKELSLADAAKQIGASSYGPSTALVWWFFCR